MLNERDTIERKLRARIIVAIVGVLALMVVGSIVGVVSGPYVLPDLDLPYYEIDSKGRVYYWGFLCALGFGFVGTPVLLACADHRRFSGLSAWRRVTYTLKAVFILLSLFSPPAILALSVVFGRRESAVRSYCTYHLKTIMLAMYNYHDDFGCFPPAYIPDENGRPKHSWRVIILPYLEKTGQGGTEGLQRLYVSYDFSEPWDGPNNRKLASQMPIVYGCGEDLGWRASNTSYLLITGDRAAFAGSRALGREEIRDEASKTILAVETRNSGINWMEPRDYPIEQLRFGATKSFQLQMGANHPGGANAGFADGSVRFLHENKVKNKTLKALATIDGGERIILDDL